jgi:hypothetical protein
MSVEALPGPLKQGDVLQKLADLTGATMEMEVLTKRGDATPVISLTGGDVTLPTQSTTANRGRVQFALLAADTTSLDAGAYYWAAWRRNSGSSRPAAEGTFELSEKGFV